MIEPDKEGPLISLVVAVAANGVIGVDGGLAWRISDDLKWFKRMTLGKPIIMGRKTFDSIGKPLPGRDNIVVTRNSSFGPEGVLTASSLDEAEALAQTSAAALDATEICIIGGAAIYEQTLPIADRIYFTKVNAVVAGDVHFPSLKQENWRKIRVGEAEKSEKNEHSCGFFILDRVKSP